MNKKQHLFLAAMISLLLFIAVYFWYLNPIISDIAFKKRKIKNVASQQVSLKPMIVPISKKASVLAIVEKIKMMKLQLIKLTVPIQENGVGNDSEKLEIELKGKFSEVIRFLLAIVNEKSFLLLTRVGLTAESNEMLSAAISYSVSSFDHTISDDKRFVLPSIVNSFHLNKSIIVISDQQIVNKS